MSQKKRQPQNNDALTANSAGAPPSSFTPPATAAVHKVSENGPLLKKIFYASLVLMLGIIMISGYNVGFHTDEMDMDIYCKANCAYYTSGGKDTSFLGVNTNDDTRTEAIMRYYGTAFEYIPVIFNKVTGLDKQPGEYNSRHIFIQLFAVLGILFAGLIARKFGGWRYAIASAWLIFLTPEYLGAGLFNSKDIPFCAGYVATVYFIIRFLEELPTPCWKTTALLMLVFAFTTGTRIGGLMLVASLFLFILVYMVTNRQLRDTMLKNITALSLRAGAVVLGGMALVVVSWPYLLMDPLGNLSSTLSVVKKFPMRIPLNFEGIHMTALDVPPHYIPKYMSVTIPVIILLIIVIGIALAIYKLKKHNGKLAAILLFTSIFPVLYAIGSNVAIYTHWRHVLFIYPGLCVLGAVALIDIITEIPKPAVKYAIWSVCGLGLVSPVMWMIKNHPYEYSYFNELAGGYKKGYYNYETDYWKIGTKGSLEWLMEHEHAGAGSDSVTVASDMPMFIKYYLKRHYPTAKVKVVLSDLPTMYGQEWTYAIFSKEFLAPDYLEQFFPPTQTIHAEKIDNMPEVVVLKDVIRLDLQARNAFANKEYAKADSILTTYLKRDAPTNVGLYGVWALVKAYTLQNDEALRIGNLAMQYNISDFSNLNALCGMGIAFANKKEYDAAISKLQEAAALVRENPFAPGLLQQVIQLKKNAGVTP
ncbi:MAG: glycosyltransferase family 39 protein [Taibaiella sp.]|nr:glycosyltransferase family 39 protein [Taibaiella sp.]